MSSIFQVTEKISKESGGLRTAIINLDNYINNQNDFTSTILTVQKEEEDKFLEFPSKKITSWCYSRNLKLYVEKNISKINLLHLHGVFMYPLYISNKIAHKNGVKTVVTAHGMLEPWYLKDKMLKKKIYLNLILNKILKNTSVLHAITPLEKDNLFNLTKHKNIIEIPNLINYKDLPDDFSYNPNEEYLLNLGRIHPGKGLDVLIQSFSKIDNKKIKLKIVGFQNNYSNVLKKICVDLKIDNRVEFIDGVNGQEKYKLYANAKAFVAPSYSEAIGMVNLEAAICKTPVVTTFNTGIKPEWNNNGGLMINPELEHLTNALNQVNNWSDSERNERGLKLCEFVKNNYSWEKKGHLWIDLYNSLK